MRQNIVLQFRPRLVVRKVELEYGSLEIGGHPARIHYTVANTGGIDANIVRKSSFIGYAEVKDGFSGFPSKRIRLMPPSYSQPFDETVSVPLKAGEGRKFRLVDLTDDMFKKIKLIQARHTPHLADNLFGVISICAEIQYSDDSGILRRTGIRRVLDIDTWRFSPSADYEEDEYTD